MTLAARLGEWALLLKLVNGFLRDRVVRAREPLSMAIAGANGRLDAKGLGVFDPRNETERAKAVARTIGVSLDLLSETERARFGELAVFPEDAEIPVGIVQRLWAATGDLDEIDAEDQLSRLFDLSLLLNLDLGQRFFRLHDTTRHFLRNRAGKDSLVTLHAQLAGALDGAASAETDARTRCYYYLFLPHHLAAANERAKLDALLLDPAWLQAKLQATANPQALAADYQLYGVGEAQSLVGRALRLIGGVCARDPLQLLPQLIGRLAGFEVLAKSRFLDVARQILPRPSIVPVKPTLTPPGAEVARLEGHTGSVSALCVLPAGRLASGSDDSTIRLWDVASGAETARLEGHRGTISSLCVLADGRLASGSWDGKICLWDPRTGIVSLGLGGGMSPIQSLYALKDGRLASGSLDGRIRLWDIASGVEIACLKGHEGPVVILCQLADGRLASGSSDATIRIWDVTGFVECECLRGHRDTVSALCALPDGRLASGSWDEEIRIWNIEAAAEPESIGQHDDAVSALCILPDGRLASGSWDETICLWDLTTRKQTAYIEGHTDKIDALCVLADGRLASGSADETIRLWDAATAFDIFPGGREVRAVLALCLLPSGLIFGSRMGKSVFVCDFATGQEKDRFFSPTVCSICLLKDGRVALGDGIGGIKLLDVQNYRESWHIELGTRIGALCTLADGRLASASLDRTIWVWDVETGVETACLKGHTGPVSALCQLSDGRLASGSRDRTIRLWAAATGVERARLEGHTGAVNALCPLPDGRLASGSDDGTIRLWDPLSGAETARLEGHTGFVNALCLLPDGRLASGSMDNTIRRWDAVAGTETARLEVDAPVRALVAIGPNRLVAGNLRGSVHWLEIVD